MVGMPPETQKAWDDWANDLIRREIKAALKGIGVTLREKFEADAKKIQTALDRRTKMIEAAEKRLNARIDALEKNTK